METKSRENMETEVFETPGEDVQYDALNDGKIYHLSHHLIKTQDIDTTQKSAETAFEEIIAKHSSEQDLKSEKTKKPKVLSHDPLTRLRELQDELTTVKEEMKKYETAEVADKLPESEKDALKELKRVEESLTGLYNSELVARAVEARKLNSIPDEMFKIIPMSDQGQQSIVKALFEQIDAIRKKSITTSRTGENVKYELHLGTDQALNARIAKLNELEGRVARIEKLVGNWKTVKTSNNAVSEIAALQNQLKYCDVYKLELLSKRLKSLNGSLTSMAQSGQSGKVELDHARIEELCNKVDGMEKTTTEVPTIVERLKALKPLHEESAVFSQKVRDLEKQQREISTMVKDNETLSQMIISNFDKNVEIIKNNSKSIKERIEKLSK
mmetsp:Transcript_57803/g.65959  ORF Transcript_57803/g.65959 Transcript_57803/m.65959 type:complete len:385 (-) Transcript_57803:42-1196(-)